MFPLPSSPFTFSPFSRVSVSRHVDRAGNRAGRHVDPGGPVEPLAGRQKLRVDLI